MVFSNDDAKSFYQEATRDGLSQYVFEIKSDDADFLNVPWELLYDPKRRKFLAPLLAGMYRTRSKHAVMAPMEYPSGDKFRVLLVICRPYGERDVPYRKIARPVIRVLKKLEPRVSLDVLRPPTFDALSKLLNKRQGYYHLVHFDGARSLSSNFDWSSNHVWL